MTVPLIVALLLVLAVLLGWVRLWRWQRAAGSGGSARWRIAALALLQPLVAGALGLTLFPPAGRAASDRLIVATAGTSPLDPVIAAARAVPGRVVALPEAPPIPDAAAVPDLATALRRWPATRLLVVLGRGLTPRDLDSARGLGVTFAPPAAPQGITMLAPPGNVAAGAGFAVSGQAEASAGARAELVDPAGRVTDRQVLAPGGGFTLMGTARAAGTVQFGLHLRRADGTLIEAAEVPVLITPAGTPRLLILAGAPGPEVKYLRRWASDAGFAVQAQIAAGGGIALGDPPIALTEANLKRYDAAIVDARAWAGLGGGGRAALLGAVRGGMGLLLRADEEGATRSLWRSQGLPLGGNGAAPVALPDPGVADGSGVADKDAPAIARTRAGIGSRDVPATLSLDDPVLPEVSRLAGTWLGPEAVPLLPDAAGSPLAAWRQAGAGRIAGFAVEDSYALALTGRGDLFAQWWSQLLGTIARPAGQPALIAGPFWAGERAALCGTAPALQVEQPDGTAVPVLADRAADGCAAVWPGQPGWHRLMTADDSRAFFVQPADALPALRARRDRDATLRLAFAGTGSSAAGGGTINQAGSPWPWFLLWLLGCGLLWTLERTGRGRGRRDQDSADLDRAAAE